MKALYRLLAFLLDTIGSIALVIWAVATVIAVVVIIGTLCVVALPLLAALLIRSSVAGESPKETLKRAQTNLSHQLKAANEQ